MESPRGSGTTLAGLLVLTNLLSAYVTVFSVAGFCKRFHGGNAVQRRAMQASCCECSGPIGSTLFDCPPTEGSIEFDTSGLVSINISSESKLCTLIEFTSAGYLKPVGRSYDANNWEPSAGDYSTLKFECLDGSCSVNLPDLGGSARYQLTTFNAPTYSSNDIIARFLEQTTFGPTKAEISSFDTNNLPFSFAKWIDHQQRMVPLTSHREYYRRHTNARFEVATSVGAVTHPCQKNTRYRRFAFSVKDAEKILTIATVGANKLLSVDGFVRTVVDGPVASLDGTVTLVDGKYLICSKGAPQNVIGGEILLEVSPKQCLTFHFNTQGGNPSVEFIDEQQPNIRISIEANQATPIDQQYIQDESIKIQELLITTDLTDPACMSIGEPGNPINPVFAIYGGDYWIHDPRFEMFDNTVDSPAEDGGGNVVKATANFGGTDFSAICANTQRTFLNEDSCILSDKPATCAVGSDHGDFEHPEFLVPVDHSTIRAIYDSSGAGAAGTFYLYAVDGLRIADDDTSSPACQRGKSRWIPVDCSITVPATVSPATETIFANLISQAAAADQNPNLLDVQFTRGLTCEAGDAKMVGFKVTDLGGKCWVHVHRNHLNVYDFTPWSRNHPGNSQFRNPIKEFAEAGFSTLLFPDWHEMDRWQSNRRGFGFVGRLGDSINYYDVPVALRTQSFNEAVGFDPSSVSTPRSTSQVDSTRTLVCGSPNEVENVAALGGSQGHGAFDSWTRYFLTSSKKDLQRQKRIVWTHISLEADDQLRQRVAWALAQILVVSTEEIEKGPERTEMFMGYYDIFVRNAFGNYRDILKEVAYSPLMSDMLTYYGSKSTAFVWETEGNLEFADENFAREVMQLFTTGLHKLGKDGNRIIDEEGNAVRVYTNEDIVEYARVWTGFKLQPKRGNIENDGEMNRIDPLQIDETWRDHFPKMGLDNKYIGDGVPLCADLPSKHFLAKGAVYKLLGERATPNLQKEPLEWAQHTNTQRLRLEPNGANSLFSKLCGSTDPSSCQYAINVELDQDVPCSGNECSIDTVRSVEVADGIFYEYIRPPCVYQAFYDNAKLLAQRKSRKKAICADPRTEVASTACCPDGSKNTGFWNDKFWGERSLFATSYQRCRGKLCAQRIRPSCDEQDQTLGLICKDNTKFWTNTDCTLRVKIHPTGMASIVHAVLGVDTADIAKHVQEDTKTCFRVEWTNSASVTNLLLDCEAIAACNITIDGMCMCDVSVAESQVFFDDNIPASSKQVLSSLHIGSFEPDKVDMNYVSNLVGEVTWHSLAGVLSPDSIFQVTDANGLLQFRKNVQSIVSIPGTSIAFRNPVHFMSLEDEEPRDAHDETEAALDSYFYHPNTAPFLVLRFAQRFGLSNPSPSLIERAVSAFQTGMYEFLDSGEKMTFGSGKYGDMASMVACLLLDPEFREVILDKDPSHGSLKEPLMKVVGLMRSMEFQLLESVPFIDFDFEIFESIGQMAHELPSVFSFFLPEYQPSGAITQASLVAPEAQVITGPRIVKLLNGLMGLIKYGLDPCYDGLGAQSGEGRQLCGRFEAGQYDLSAGRLTYTPSIQSAESAIEELSTLLTAGRLSSESREAIKQVFLSEADPSLALVQAQQLVVTTPEFHSTGLVHKSGETRPIPQAPPASTKPYKAVVYVMLAGGFDSFNMLAPHTCSTTNSNGDNLLQQYYNERTSLSITDEERSRVVDAAGQPCEQFVVHEGLEIVEKLYNEGDLAFFANAGVINKKATKENYRAVTTTQLFAHNTMRSEAQRIDPFDGAPGTGILGRMCDVLTVKGFNAQPITIQDATVATVGVPGKSVDPLFVSTRGTTQFNPAPRRETFDPRIHLEELNEATDLHSSVFGETWSTKLNQALNDNERLSEVLSTVNISQSFVGSKYAQRMKAVAAMILSQRQRGTDRDVIFVELGGWDHHQRLKTELSLHFSDLNEALTYFKDEMTVQGYWEDVSLVVTSDFGRTLTANSGDGSDHAWAGNYFVMGGSVKGGKIHGQYPEDITEAGPYNLGRGRLMPTLSWESILNSVAEWMGVDGPLELDYCLPNRIGTGTQLFTKEDVFNV